MKDVRIEKPFGMKRARAAREERRQRLQLRATNKIGRSGQGSSSKPIPLTAHEAVTIDHWTSDELIEVLGKTLGLKDNDTAAHSKRVRRYCLEIAKAMGSSPEGLKQIARVGTLHDIGKIAIPDAILRKNGKLSPQERRIMETHAWMGFYLLRRIQFLEDVANVVLAHHERYDGKGYPRGLKEDEIPRGARIFAVADTLDAMTSDRPYRRALPFSAACGEILRESGRQFDPKVVEAFDSIPERVLLQIMSSENRCSARVPFRAMVTCIQNGQHYTLKGVNISEGGMLLEKDEGIRLGEELEVEFELPKIGRPLRLKAEPIRRERPDRSAIAFHFPHPEDKVALQRYMAGRLKITQEGSAGNENTVV